MSSDSALFFWCTMAPPKKDDSEPEATIEAEAVTCKKCKSGAEAAVWTNDDDKILLEALLNQKHAGNQADNSFKPQAWQVVVNAMNKSVVKGALKDKILCKGIVCHVLFFPFL
jgi:Myb/SANT-like DNA-binding domain